MPADASAAALPCPRVTGRAEAEGLVTNLLGRMSALERLLESETAQIRVGRLREGLADEARKGALTASYLAGLESVKANAVALARFAPDALERLRREHARFGRAVEANQRVLATARAVTESLIRGIADDLGRAARPQVYGARGTMTGTPRGVRGEPLVVSRRL